MVIRKSEDRGYFENDWLKSYHSFSFAEYFDRNHMNFRNLRVINHDFIAASAGFPTHPHRDMEILTYVLKGQVAHQDSMGNKAYVKAGEVQVMSAGTGVSHSEFNPDAQSGLELLQIWITPGKSGLTPSYFQKSFTSEKHNKLVQLVSPTGEGGSLKIHQDIKVYGALLDFGKTLEYSIPSARFAWLQVAQGILEVNGVKLNKGDGASFSGNDEKVIQLKSLEAGSDFVLFDLN